MSHSWNSVWHGRTGSDRRVGWWRWSVHWLCFPSQSRVALNMLYTEREVVERKIVNVSVKQKGSMRWGIERIQLRPPTNEAQRRAKKLASRLRSLWRFWFVLYSRYTRYPKKYFTQTYGEVCMETPCWCSPGWAPTWRTETNRNSSVLYHKAKNPFEAKICMKISFQLL